MAFDPMGTSCTLPLSVTRAQVVALPPGYLSFRGCLLIQCFNITYFENVVIVTVKIIKRDGGPTLSQFDLLQLQLTEHNSFGG